MTTTSIFRHEQNQEQNNNKQHRNIKGGVAIAIREIYAENIYQINRIGKPIMEIRFETGHSVNNLPIINTYAPHMRYGEDEIHEYWIKIQN